ncbi:hypothetical protein ACIBCA_05430 [Kitasatospora sp. NPDC051170]|uniref:hypothetical protein n=1 Tax=Kitasatospora sp. NPDC051170 TaxID=3364056 RepID=UPI0037B46F35
MAGETGFMAKPEDLKAAGNNAVTVGGRIPDETAKLAEPTTGAVASLAGWQSAAPLQNCGAAWKKLLDRLANDMKAAGGNLINCADNYQRGDTLPMPTTPTVTVPDPFKTKLIGGKPLESDL